MPSNWAHKMAQRCSVESSRCQHPIDGCKCNLSRSMWWGLLLKTVPGWARRLYRWLVNTIILHTHNLKVYYSFPMYKLLLYKCKHLLIFPDFLVLEMYLQKQWDWLGKKTYCTQNTPYFLGCGKTIYSHSPCCHCNAVAVAFPAPPNGAAYSFSMP